MLYGVNDILSDIEKHMNNKEPFSIVRIGDGDLKLLDELVRGKINVGKFNRSGIPHEEGKWVLKIYRNSCNEANYTSSFEMYYTDKFWGRKFSPGTRKKVEKWEDLYRRVGITNKNFCNPEIGHLLFLDENKNLLNLLSGKSVCLLTCFPRCARIAGKVGKAKEVNIIKIPPINKGHYSKYREINNEILKNIKKTDIFLVAAGAIGKAYSLTIKNNGGMSIDVGQVLNTWAGKPIAGRFKHILKPGNKPGTFKLTDRANKFRKFI